VAYFAFPYVLAICGLCFVLAFHRAKVVHSEKLAWQILAYILFFIGTTALLFSVGILIKRNAPRLATIDDIREQLRQKENDKSSAITAPPSPPLPVLVRPQGQMPPLEIRLTFKASPLFTPMRQIRIEREVNEYCRYLSAIGYDLPKEFPPIGTMPGKVLRRLSFSPGTIYSEYLLLPEDYLDDPQHVRAAFSFYIFERLLNPNSSDLNGFLFISEIIYSNYYLADFSNVQPSAPRKDAPGDKWISAIWDIREKHGREFANKSLFYTFKQWHIPVDNIQNESFDKYFGRRFSIGLDVEDNRQQHAGSIAKILNARGIQLDGINWQIP
jgi:hypothetical protein